ncbi:hypothetical protein [Thauera humireducens]|uniref:hypothetical protein n=1 Tax=Thauera humireducens TaxID=1134435 RepID=UPI0031201F0F
MKHSLLVAALVAIAVSACGKQEQPAPTAAPAPTVQEQARKLHSRPSKLRRKALKPPRKAPLPQSRPPRKVRRKPSRLPRTPLLPWSKPPRKAPRPSRRVQRTPVDAAKAAADAAVGAAKEESKK